MSILAGLGIAAGLGALGGLFGRKTVSHFQPKPAPVDRAISNARLNFLNEITNLSQYNIPTLATNMYLQNLEHVPKIVASIDTPKALTPFGTIDLYGLKRAQVQNELMPTNYQLKMLQMLNNQYANYVANPIMQFESFRYRLPSQAVVKTNPIGDMFQGALGGGLAFLKAIT